jgi:hypothetical protein
MVAAQIHRPGKQIGYDRAQSQYPEQNQNVQKRISQSVFRQCARALLLVFGRESDCYSHHSGRDKRQATKSTDPSCHVGATDEYFHFHRLDSVFSPGARLAAARAQCAVPAVCFLAQSPGAGDVLI